MIPQFIYFDLGKVLVNFSLERMFRQMADVSGVEPEQVGEAIFGNGLQRDFEMGIVSEEQFHEAFSKHVGRRPDRDALLRAASDIFELNLSILPVVAQLAESGHRLGVLSNTCISHWEHCRARYRIVAEAFSVHALSYEVGAAKPDATIYQAAAERAGVPPEAIFFIDDLADNVQGALEAGFDAVQYTSTPELVAELRRREIRLNYY